MSETIVQKKTAKLLQRNLSEILARPGAFVAGTMLTVSIVRISRDLSSAKIYITAFPDEKLTEIVDLLNEKNWEIRKELAARIRNHMRKVPEILFYKDDSFAEAEKIDSLLDQINAQDEQE